MSEFIKGLHQAITEGRPEIWINYLHLTPAAAKKAKASLAAGGYISENIYAPQQTFTKPRRTSGIKVPGHRGSFYIVQGARINNKRYYLLESEQYGEDAPWVAIDQDENFITDNITEGRDDLEAYLQEREQRGNK